MSKILYLVSSRSFSYKLLGRKISEVISCFKKKSDVDVLCGGDSKQIQTSHSNSYGNQEYFKNEFRKNKLLEPILISLSELKDVLHDITFFFTIRKKIKSNKYELIWERSSRLHISGLTTAKISNIPYVLEWKDNLVNYKFSFFKVLALIIEKIKVRYSDFIVVESEVLKQHLVNQGVNREKIFVAYNGVDVGEFNTNVQNNGELKRKINFQDGDILVGYLGSYAFYHSTELLIEAAKVTSFSNPNIKYIMVGNGMHFENCVELAKSLNLYNKVVFFFDGVQKEQVPYILTDFDLAVLPGSTDIICPIKIFEYMSAAKPVLLPNYECNREIITTDVNGVLFAALDADDLASKIILLSKNERKRTKLGVKARETVAAEFTWDSTWGKVLSKLLVEVRT